MSDDAHEPNPFKETPNKRDRTDEAYKSIQGAEKTASDAKSARLKESRLKQEAEDKAAPRRKNGHKAKPK